MTIIDDQECDTSEDTENPAGDEREAAVEADEERKANGRARPWKRYARCALVAAVYAGAFGLAGGLGWKLWDEHAVSQAGQAAQRTAINYAQVLTSIDSNQVDQNFSAVLDGATGEFKDTYTKASVQLRQLLIDNKAAAHGTVVDAAIQSQTKNKVVVLLMVDQTVSNAVRPDGRVDRSRMRITMENAGGRWLASKVELP
ncbi:Mce protein [Mycobacterium mantenii]|uniref:Mce protein n=1 Tax=Mycobacterium mantenii TaxID=560555 RepID=A0A1A2TF69_MYCNT|nr:Mce protein [Mycobacterium mantenii]OBH42264.1 Mce protein [Mycobacterium mantenii]OBH60259.1 Mce protein [Mycobacterium mantenii]OBH75076.1 Mce protein [Mycobacterium mantenii]OBH75488.1 Mce protein [Mycobacterium mantenii]